MSTMESGPVLVLDDDLTSGLIVQHYLQNGGLETDLHDKAEAALEALVLREYSLVISDWFMPDINGEAFLRRAKSMRADVPVIFLTSNTDLENAISMLRAGAEDYLLKPVSQHELLFRVSRTLQQARDRRLLAQINRERELLELENRQLVNWRLMYATKESEQVTRIINLLARTINQSGGFMWLDLIEASSLRNDDGVLLQSDVYDLMVTAATQQRRVIELLTFINTVHTQEMALEAWPLAGTGIQRLESILEELVPLAERRGRTLNHYIGRLADMEGTLMVEPDLMRKIVGELVVNAVKYSPPGARIIVEVTRESRKSGQALGIHFRNPVRRGEGANARGVGIPYELSESVFDLFYTLNAYPEQLDEEEWIAGTGLYLVRQILQRMNAWIEVKNGIDYVSSPPEPFVQFLVLLPLHKETP